jgi:hemoglobin-like flavoprotein
VSTQALLRDTLEAILAADDKFPTRFYEILFERHPEYKALFVRSSPNVQRLKFAQSLTWIVDHADDPTALTKELHGLADRHVVYGVTDEMYPIVSAALLDTLHEGLGAKFTPEVEAAWRGAIDMIVAAMRTHIATKATGTAG